LQPRAAGRLWGSGRPGCRQTGLCFSRAFHKMTNSTSSPEDMGKQRAKFGWGGSRWQWLVAMDRGRPNNATEYWLWWGGAVSIRTWVYTRCAWAGGTESQFVVNNLTAIGARERQLFYVLRSIVVFRRIFVRCLSLIAS
jgi:hypothetical protein